MKPANLHVLNDEGTLAKVKEALGDERFQSAWEVGSRWSLEEAVKKVLGE